MLGAALLSGLLLTAAPADDEEFLTARLKSLAARYEDFSRRRSGSAVRARAAVVRELAHLPFLGGSRERAGRLLARIVGGDPSYRVRADAARAIGRVGTARALRAMYDGLFGEEARSRRFALLYTVLPEALARLHHAEDLEWLSLQILRPAARRQRPAPLRATGPLQWTALALTLEGVGRSKARVLGPDLVALASHARPEVRVAAIGALVGLDMGGAEIRRALSSESYRLRAAAAGYRRLGPEEALRVITDPSSVVRRHAIRGLAERPPREAVGPLVEGLRAEQDQALRLDLAETLHRLTGKEFGTDAQLWGGWWSANRQRFERPGELEPGGRVYFFQVPMRTRRIVFVIDVSASMSREDEQGISRIEHAARELSQTLARLPRGARFRILAYSSSVRQFPEKKTATAPGSAQEAAAWLRKIKPAGATNTYGALMTALEAPEMPDTIVLLSDGNPYRCSWRGKTYSEHEQILAEVRRKNEARRVHIHTVALLSGAFADEEDEDPAAASEFLNRLADQNRGEFREVR